MDENLHNTDDLFRKAIEAHEEMPSANIWENIDRNLDKKKVISISRRYAKLKWVAAALLIFSAGMAMYIVNTKIKNKQLVKQNHTVIKKLSEKDAPVKPATKDVVANAASANKSGTKTAAVSQVKKDKADNLSLSDNSINERKSAEKKRHTADKRTSHQADLAKLSAGSTKLSVKPKLNKEGKATETVKKTADNIAKEEKMAFDKTEAGRNKDRQLEKNTKVPVDNSLTSSAKKSVVNITAVREQKMDLLTVPKSNESLEKSLESHSSNNKIKTEEKAADYKSRNSMAKGNKKGALEATLFYSTDFVSSRVDNDQHDFREDDRNAIKSKESIKNAYTTGILLHYNTGRKITFQTGITFSSLNTTIQPKTIFARPDPNGNINYRFNCSAGYTFVTVKTGAPLVSGDSVTALRSTNILQYIGIPVAVTYNIGKGKFSLHPAFGIAVNFLTKGKIETVIAGAGPNPNQNVGTDHIDGLNAAYFNGSISFEANYNISRNIAFSFTPVERIALSAINKDTPVKTYLNSFGLAAVLQLRL